jgi:dipeptidyl aminopeptidase/acylaminoacyl peptidase
MIVEALGFCVAQGQAQDQEWQFQEAIHLMETKGDYPAAIRLFEEVVKGSGRTLAARSLLYRGICYEKLGREEAQKAYQRLIREFPDQATEVAQARAQLAALSPTGALGVAVRQVWSPTEGPMTDILGAPSPDGRYLAFTHWETANLAVYDLSSGEKRDLTDGGTWMEPDQWADWSIWSPDGERIAYAWFNKDQEELRIVGVGGSEPRVLYRDEEVQFIRPHTWSRDGKSILAWLEKEEGPNEMVLISVADGSVRMLKSPAPASIKMSLSPDGRYVVYDVPAKEYVGKGDIFLLATDGSREVRLVEHPANDYGPVWAPDGKTVVFASDRAGTVGVWLTQVVDGKPTGVVDRVKRDMGKILPMGFTRNGALYYGLGAGMHDVYAAFRGVQQGTRLVARRDTPGLRVEPEPGAGRDWGKYQGADHS